MSEIMCGYHGDREAMLIAYVYDEITPAERAAFDEHLAACARCRTEVAAVGGVRRQLAHWSPPSFLTVASSGPAADAALDRAGDRWWRRVPAWAQVAAAMLFLGVAAGLANLDVHYDARSGLNVHTGWARQAGNPSSPANVANPANVADRANPAPWRADLGALEQQLRTEMHDGANAVAPAGARLASSSESELARRLKAMVDESERRQQRELALRVTSLMQEWNVQRQADLHRIDQSLGLIQDRTGVEVLRNRQMIDYYLQRVSQRQ